MAIKNIQMNMLNESNGYDTLWPEIELIFEKGSYKGTGSEIPIYNSMQNSLLVASFSRIRTLLYFNYDYTEKMNYDYEENVTSSYPKPVYPNIRSGFDCFSFYPNSIVDLHINFIGEKPNDVFSLGIGELHVVLKAKDVFLSQKSDFILGSNRLNELNATYYWWAIGLA